MKNVMEEINETIRNTSKRQFEKFDSILERYRKDRSFTCGLAPED